MDQPTPRQSPRRGLRLLDLVGLVAGYGLASLLARTVWPRFVLLTGAPAVAFAFEYAWLGLAMSGPIILGLDPRRSSALPPRRPERSGRPIGEVAALAQRLAPPTPPPVAADRPEYTRAELAWMGIGGYWIALTFFVVPAHATDAPWTLAGLIPLLGIFGLMIFLPHRDRAGDAIAPLGWTHFVAAGLLWTWPVAWGLLVLLGRTI